MKWLSYLAILSSAAVSSHSAWAGDLEWSGNYRVEGLKVNNPELNGSRSKQYMLHHLVLNPKINAYDGITIQGRFDIMNSSTYPNSQVGNFFGSSVQGDTTGAGNSTNTSTLADNQKSDFIAISQLYLTYAHEFGLLTVGRAPLHFGLGMTYNAGRGAFDHWFDNRDLVAYKFVTGNISIMPVIAKLAENDPGFSDDVDDYMMQIQYDNPETDLKIGLLYRARHAGTHGNTTPGAPVFGEPTSPSATGYAPYKGEYYNFFLSRYIVPSLKFGVEFGMQKGKTGVQTSTGNVEMNGIGVALELDYVPNDSKFNAFLKAGMATGDDPNTENTYEGYIFDRNYDVAFLLFNHPMGNYDVFRTAANRNATRRASSAVDEESISNVIYLAPSFKYKWTDKFDTLFGLTYAQLNSDPLKGITVGKSVGYELDATFNYKPYDGVQWVNRIGVFAPGSAFAGGTNNYSTSTIFGLETKAAITF
jgi:hypothetical protein